MWSERKGATDTTGRLLRVQEIRASPAEARIDTLDSGAPKHTVISGCTCKQVEDQSVDALQIWWFALANSRECAMKLRRKGDQAMHAAVEGKDPALWDRGWRWRPGARTTPSEGRVDRRGHGRQTINPLQVPAVSMPRLPRPGLPPSWWAPQKLRRQKFFEAALSSFPRAVRVPHRVLSSPSFVRQGRSRDQDALSQSCCYCARYRNERKGMLRVRDRRAHVCAGQWLEGCDFSHGGWFYFRIGSASCDPSFHRWSVDDLCWRYRSRPFGLYRPPCRLSLATSCVVPARMPDACVQLPMLPTYDVFWDVFDVCEGGRLSPTSEAPFHKDPPPMGQACSGEIEIRCFATNFRWRIQHNEPQAISQYQPNPSVQAYSDNCSEAARQYPPFVFVQPEFDQSLFQFLKTEPFQGLLCRICPRRHRAERDREILRCSFCTFYGCCAN